MEFQGHYLFGIELELILTPRSPDSNLNNWDDVAQYLNGALRTLRVPSHVHDSENPTTYRNWEIMSDGSIAQQRNRNRWGVELASAIQMYGAQHAIPSWRENLRRVWQCLEDNFEIVSSDTCGTHVHVSPVTLSGWRTNHWFPNLKNVAKAVVYFERCVDSLMPSNRLTNGFCKSNRYNPRLKPLQMVEIFALIESCQTPEDLANVMCYGDNSRYFRWNFTRLANPEQAGTLEFRQPPGSISRKDAVSWSVFVAAFIRSAIIFQGNPDEVATIEDLKSFVMWICLDIDRRDLERIFEHTTQLGEGPLVEEDPVEDIPRRNVWTPSDDFKDKRWMLVLADYGRE